MLPGKSYTVSDIVAMLKRRAVWLIAPPLLGLFGALVYSSTQPNIYESDALIAIVPQRVPDTFVRSTVTLKTEDRLAALTTQVTSRTVLEQVILEFNLYGEERKRMPMEDVVQLMRANVVVELEAPRRGPRGPEPPHAFHVRFQYPDAVVATRVTERLGSMFIDQNARDRSALAEAADDFLVGQLANARKSLEEQEDRLESFRELHGNELSTQIQSNMQAIQSAQLQIQALVEAIARDNDRKLMLERLYNEAQREPALTAPVAPAAQNNNQPLDPLAQTGGTAQQRLVAARELLSRMQLRVTAEHPDMVKLRRTVSELERLAAAESLQASGDAPVPATISPLEAQRRETLRQQKAEIESLDRQAAFKASEEARLRRVVSDYQQRIEAAPGVESEYVKLTRDYETQQNAYKELLTKSEAAKTALDLERRQIGEQFRLLDAATVPQRPVSPVRVMINGIGFGLGLFLGFAVAAGIELRDSTYRTANDIIGALSLPVLASVPMVETAAEKARRHKRRLLSSLAAASVVTICAVVAWAMRLWTFLI